MESIAFANSKIQTYENEFPKLTLAHDSIGPKLRLMYSLILYGPMKWKMKNALGQRKVPLQILSGFPRSLEPLPLPQHSPNK